MPKVKILNLIFKRRYKGVNITFRKWIKENRKEMLLNDNAAKSFGYKNKEELINALFDTRAMDYAKGDNIWLEWDEDKSTIKSVTLSKPNKGNE